ncbi:MAG: M43 family zinc metalloprotease [Saprospiraceae bacterium]
MKHIYFAIFLYLFLFSYQGVAQRNCATMEVLEQMKAADPLLEQRMDAIEQHTRLYVESGAVRSRTVVTIPVVVHVVYRTSGENLSAAQIQSQIDVLNQDFRALNNDLTNTPDEFKPFIGNADIEFCLAKRDPKGNATTGITRKQTDVFNWGNTNRVKRNSQGGVDPWDPSKYLNIWVCSLGGGLLGYAQFPGGDPATDGVVIDYRYFGRNGSAKFPFNLGRTTTHEVGHWLNLRHIWGDAACGNDFVEDTPLHNGSNSECPIYPHYSTCEGAPVEMTMNYMDYTDDRCMYMFTAGQVARMHAVLAPGGFRASLLNSDGCLAPGTSGGGGGTPTVTCNPPTGLNATNITTTSASLNWTAAANATAYNLRLRVVGSATWSTVTVNGTTFAATNLSPATAYEFQVQTVCGTTSSTNFASANFTTQQQVVITCNDVYENNNTQSAARSIAVNTLIRAKIGSSTDLDWFRFTVSSTQRNVRIKLSNLPADYDLRAYRSLSVLGTSATNGTADEQVIINNAFPSTTYHIRVSGYNGAFNNNQCYELIIETSSTAFREGGEEVPIEPQQLRLFPNPASDEIMLDIPVQTDAPTQIMIYDITGKLLHTQVESLLEGNTLAKVNVQHLPSGLYVARVQNGTFTATERFVISK